LEVLLLLLLGGIDVIDDVIDVVVVGVEVEVEVVVVVVVFKVERSHG